MLSSLMCRIVGHKPEDDGIFNQGLFFAKCGRCDQDVFRQKGSAWFRVPKGLRVTWSKQGKHSLAPWKATNIARRRKS